MEGTVDEWKAELQGSLLKFIMYFFKKRTGRPFTLSQPDSRLSHYITISQELMSFERLETNRLMINVPPGHGKSTMLVYFVAWCFTFYPDSQFLYISFSKSLAEKHTAEIKAIMSMLEYQRLFGVSLAHDSTAKGRFRTSAGGAVTAFGSAGSITGCFDYDALVLTEQGMLPIGNIVDKRIKTKALSYNAETCKYEFQEITGWFENPENEIVEVQLSNGGAFECTPDHKILTRNRGWVRAEFLLPTDTINYRATYIKFSTQNTLWYRGVANPIKFLGSKLINLFSMIRSFSFRNIVANSTNPNINDGSARNVKFLSNLFTRNVGKSKFANFKDLFGAKLKKSWFHSPVINRIRKILFSGSVCQVFNSVIKFVSIQMPGIFKGFARSYKRLSNHLMNSYLFAFSIPGNGHAVISGGVNPGLKNFPLIKNFLSCFVSLPAVITSNLTSVRNTIKSIRPRNISPLNIVFKRHVDKTYCLEIENNHNFTINTGSGTIVVSNCDAGLPNLNRFSGAVIIDDAHKNDEVHSDTMRQAVIDNYNQTIKPRPRGDNVGIISIGQRLHEQDLSSFLETGGDGYDWKIVKLPAIDDSGNVLAPNIKSKESLLIERDKNPYVFASQYQQDPVPAGGGIFKTEWFHTLDIEPKIIKTFITVDTAETEKEYNDATVFSLWGIYKPVVHGREIDSLLALHWLDCWEIRVEPKDLVNSFLDFWSTAMERKIKPDLTAIEKKSTGSTLCSYLKNTPGIRVHEIQRTRASGSKTARFLRAQEYIARNLITLPTDALHTQKCITHMAKITANNTHRFDDIADTAVDAIQLALIDHVVSLDAMNDEQRRETARTVMAEYNNITRLRHDAYFG